MGCNARIYHLTLAEAFMVFWLFNLEFLLFLYLWILFLNRRFALKKAAHFRPLGKVKPHGLQFLVSALEQK